MEIVKFENKQDRFTHSNKLIEARYNLSLQEQRLILMMVSMIKPGDQDFKEYQIQIRDFAAVFELKGESIITHAKKAAKSLRDKSLIIKDPDKTLYTGWISSAEFPEGKGYVSLCFDPKLKPYLFQLKKQYTFLENRYMVNLKSTYSIRIYMLLKQYLGIGHRTLKVDVLKEILGITSYKNYCDFRVNVLSKAVTEINNKTDLFIKFSENRTGRKIDTIIFTIEKKKENCEEIGVIVSELEKEKTPEPEIELVVEKKQKAKTEKKGFIPPSKAEWIAYCATEGIDEATAHRSFDGYEAANWHNSYGKPVLNWKTTVINNWRPKNFIPSTTPISSQSPSPTVPAPEPESAEIKNIRDTIKREVGQAGSYAAAGILGSAPITKKDDLFIITVTSEKLLDFQKLLSGFKIKIEVKND